MASEEPRRTSRVRKTPTKFATDYTITLDGNSAPFLTDWDETGLKLFYDAFVSFGTGNWRKIAVACGRTLQTCEALFDQHRQFLVSVTRENADVMFQYFLSGARGSLAPTAPAVSVPSVSRPSPTASPSLYRQDSSLSARKNPATKRRVPESLPTPTKTGRRNTPRRPAEILRNGGVLDENEQGRPTTRRRLNFDDADDAGPALGGQLSGFANPLDMLAEAAANACATDEIALAEAAALVPDLNGDVAERSNASATKSRNSADVVAERYGTSSTAGPNNDGDEESLENGTIATPKSTVMKRAPGRRGYKNAASVAAAKDDEKSHLASPKPARTAKRAPAKRRAGAAAAGAIAASAAQGGADSDDAVSGDPAPPAPKRSRRGTRGSQRLSAAAAAQAASEGREAPGSSRRLIDGVYKEIASHKNNFGLAEQPADSEAGGARRPRSSGAPSDEAAGGEAGVPASADGDGPSSDSAYAQRRATFRRRPRKALPERLPLVLAQYSSWLMLGCPGGQPFQQAPVVKAGEASGGAAPKAAGEGSGAPHAVERRLRHALGLRTRRWAMAEFMTSAMDAPWLQADGMASLMERLGLGGVKATCRADMRFVREALAGGARPRRLSDDFLRRERCALHAHRLRCRAAYEPQPTAEAPRKLPDDVPPQCSVGQHVIARHPTLCTLHDGDVLTVSVSTYMVQFHRSELGVCRVPDTDVMPEGPVSSAPPLLLPPRQPTAVAHPPVSLQQAAPAAIAPAVKPEDCDIKEVGVEDLNLMDRVAKLVDRKALLLSELKEMNAQAAKQSGVTFPDDFQTSYAMRVIEVKELNTKLAEVCSPLKTRVDELNNLRTMLTRNAAPLATPLSTEDTVKNVAKHIVDESMAEASALVHELFSQRRINDGGPGGANGGAAGTEGMAPTALMLFVDDESLMHMSTKLTAMFIAIQRCAASGQDARTVQRALIKLVADLKPASHANTAHYQLITKNVGRLSCHLGAR